MLRSDLCGYSDTYIVVKRTIGLLADAATENQKSEKDLAFKNNLDQAFQKLAVH